MAKNKVKSEEVKNEETEVKNEEQTQPDTSGTIIINYRKERTLECGKLKLQPGLNEVKIADWESAKKNKVFMIHVNKGHCKEIKDFHDLTEEDQLEIVKDTFDKKALKTVKEEGELREPVEDAVDSQIKEIEDVEAEADKKKR